MAKIDLDYLLDENNDKSKILDLIKRYGPLSELGIHFFFFKENSEIKYQYVFVSQYEGIRCKKVAIALKELKNDFKLGFDHSSKKYHLDDPDVKVDDKALITEMMFRYHLLHHKAGQRIY